MNKDVNWAEIENKLIGTLDSDRYRHTLGVSYTAAAIAMAHGLDVHKARLAGLLHDCAKYVPSRERLSLCAENGIEVSEVERKNTSLLHSKLGALIASRDYGIDDPAIHGAIRWHTTGRPEMTPIEQIIYIADYIEPNRDEKITIDPDIRRLAYTDLDRCCEAIMSACVSYIRSSGKEMDPATVEAYEYYHRLINDTGKEP